MTTKISSHSQKLLRNYNNALDIYYTTWCNSDTSTKERIEAKVELGDSKEALKKHLAKLEQDRKDLKELRAMYEETLASYAKLHREKMNQKLDTNPARGAQW